jgi:hypothetical protein
MATKLAILPIAMRHLLNGLKIAFNKDAMHAFDGVYSSSGESISMKVRCAASGS